jgi:hypothetical protein
VQAGAAHYLLALISVHDLSNEYHQRFVFLDAAF